MFIESCAFYSCGDRFLDGAIVNMMPPQLLSIGVLSIGRMRPFIGFTRTRVGAERLGGKDILPGQRASCLGVFFSEGIRQPDPTGASGQIGCMESSYLAEL